ncbi:MAG: VCBS repeat-containing protein, partial [Bacteroidota bacterium]
LYLQKNGKFEIHNPTQFERADFFEDTAAEFFDADGDGDLDLFVGSGGNHRPAGDQFMADRIYLNDGKGNFTWNRRAIQPLGFNTAFVIPVDFDSDGDADLIVGNRSVPGQYGRTPQSALYENDGSGRFRDISAQKARDFAYTGMLTDGVIIDLENDGQQELIVVGEWMAPQAFSISSDGLKKISIGLEDYAGWWYAVEATDINNDGQPDLVLGNRGENFYFSGSLEAPAKLWLNDFDNNRTVEKIITQNIGGRDMPVTLKKELTGQINSLKKQNLRHSDYANKSIQDLFSEEVIASTEVKEGTYFQSAVALNEGGQFNLKALPAPVQWSCVCAIYCTDLNGDNQVDLVIGGNDDGFLPQFGKLDAGYGQILINSGNNGFELLANRDLGWQVKGDLKQLLPIEIDGAPHLLSLLNNQAPQLFKVNSKIVQ